MKKPVQSPIKKPTIEQLFAELQKEFEKQQILFDEFEISTLRTLNEQREEIVKLRENLEQEKRERYLRQQSALKQFESE